MVLTLIRGTGSRQDSNVHWIRVMLNEAYRLTSTKVPSAKGCYENMIPVMSIIELC